MARKRRRFTAEFKARVAPEALRERDSVQAIAAPRRQGQSIDLYAGEGFGRTAHSAAQGSTTSIPIFSKSRTLRVATAMLRDAAIAAIWQSA